MTVLMLRYGADHFNIRGARSAVGLLCVLKITFNQMAFVYM